jgi:EpsI family protein
MISMPSLERRAILGGMVLLLAAAAGAAAVPRRHLAEELPPLDLEADIPGQIGSWRLAQAIAPVLPAPDVQEKLDHLYNKVLTRTYVDDHGDQVMFVIAYGADQADRTTLAHLPEACYSSQGFVVFPTDVASVALPGGPFRLVHLRTQKGVRSEPVTYWTTVGGEALVDERSRRWARARYSLHGIIPDGMLVRISTIDTDAQRGYAVQADFVAQLYRSLAAPVRARLFGSIA